MVISICFYQKIGENILKILYNADRYLMPNNKSFLVDK